MASSYLGYATREELHVYHKIDRDLFTRLVLNLKRDINQSIHVMSFLLYLENNFLLFDNLIDSLVSSPDCFINVVADEAVMCLNCLSFEDYAMFLANFGQNINSLTLPFIKQTSQGKLTLPIIHQNRHKILAELKMHLNHTCYPAFEDIFLQMYNKEKEKAMEKMSQMRINMVEKSGDQQEKANHVSGTTQVISTTFFEDEQVLDGDRTIFLIYSREYPVSKAEVCSYFTRRFGDIIEAIHMPEVEEKAIKMVLHSAAKIQEIVSDEEGKKKFIINGKHVEVRKYVHKPTSGNNIPLSFGVYL